MKQRQSFVFLVASALGASALAAPSLEVRQDPRAARPNVPYHVELRVTWPGAPEAYVVAPAEIGDNPWTEARVTASRASISHGQTIISQQLTLLSPQPGELPAPPLRVEVRPAALTGASEPLVLEAEPFTIQVRPDRSAWLYGAAACAFAAACAGTYGVRRLRRPHPAPIPILSEGNHALHRARKHRLDGDVYAYYRELAGTAAGMNGVPGAAECAARMEERARAAGFAARIPTDVEMNDDLRAVEGLMTRSKEMQTHDDPR